MAHGQPVDVDEITLKPVQTGRLFDEEIVAELAKIPLGFMGRLGYEGKFPDVQVAINRLAEELENGGTKTTEEAS